jgi:hypothetical protein
MSIEIFGYIEIRLIAFGLFCADRKSGNPYGMTYDARRSSKHNGNFTFEGTIEAHDSLVNAVTFSPGRARTTDRLITNILFFIINYYNTMSCDVGCHQKQPQKAWNKPCLSG